MHIWETIALDLMSVGVTFKTTLYNQVASESMDRAKTK